MMGELSILGPKAARACELVAVANWSMRKAYKEVFGERTGFHISEFWSQPIIADHLNKLRQTHKANLTLSRLEKRAILAKAVRTPLDELDEDDPLIDEVVETFDRDGNLLRRRLKKMTTATAIDLDNKMAGHNSPEEVNITHGVVVVPAYDNWEDAAIEQQKELKKVN